MKTNIAVLKTQTDTELDTQKHILKIKFTLNKYMQISVVNFQLVKFVKITYSFQ